MTDFINFVKFYANYIIINFYASTHPKSIILYSSESWEFAFS
jgi:hypothetical protein